MNNKQKQTLKISAAILFILVGAIVVLKVMNMIDWISFVAGLLIVFVLFWFSARQILKKKPPVAIKGDLNQVSRDLFNLLGGKENIISINHCQTRILLDVIDSKVIDVEKIRALGIQGVIRPSNTKVQLVAKDMVQSLYDKLIQY